MSGLSTADHSQSPPLIDIPRHYNAAHDLLERNVRAGRADKVAFIDDQGRYTYGELAQRVAKFANALRARGVKPEQRILLALHDCIDFPVAFLGAIQAGVVPVPVNTLLTQDNFEFMLSDSRAVLAVVSAPLLPLFEPLLDKLPALQDIIVSGLDASDARSFARWMSSASDKPEIAATTCDDICFWLYSSGSTGNPKGTVHIHSSLIQTAELYARPVVGMHEQDVVFSAAKLFFAYGLGNALTFPMAVGGTAVLMAERATPAAVFKRLQAHQPTVFCGVPTLFAAMLAHPEFPERNALKLRCCTSAGEPLPEEIGKRWSAQTGTHILDGIGSTEMLHIFLSNSMSDVRYGTTGKPVPGYQVRLVDEQGQPVAVGEHGELQIAGPTSASMYWNNRDKTRNTFQGPWTRSGDKFIETPDGYYIYSGRSDDMLKVSGIYVSPAEVEAALITHAAVLEAAVVGRADDDQLIKPIAFVVLKPGHTGDANLAAELKQHVKTLLAPFKYPRWIEFVPELPKTATGKIQRFRLRS